MPRPSAGISIFMHFHFRNTRFRHFIVRHSEFTIFLPKQISPKVRMTKMQNDVTQYAAKIWHFESSCWLLLGLLTGSHFALHPHWTFFSPTNKENSFLHFIFDSSDTQTCTNLSTTFLYINKSCIIRFRYPRATAHRFASQNKKTQCRFDSNELTSFRWTMNELSYFFF